MKIEYKVDNARFCRRQFHHIELWGYYNTETVIEDLERVLDYHELRYEKYKSDYVKQWGEDAWNKHVEAAKWADQQENK